MSYREKQVQGSKTAGWLSISPTISITTDGEEVVDAWELGVRKHLASLPSAEREKFLAPATAEDCLIKIHQIRHRQRNGYHRLMEILKPVIEPLKRFEGAIDVMIQTNSGMFSPVWGPLRAVITLASDRLATLHALSQLLERLVEPLARFHDYETMFEGNLALRRAIGALYCDLVDFCTRAVRFFGKRSIRTIFGSFDKDFHEVSDNIRHHWTEIDIAANFVNISEAKAMREAEEKRRRLQVRGDVQRWLCPATVADDLQRCSEECMPHSCDWFLKSEGYRSLLASTGVHSLRVVGRPGEGKTTLAGFIINDLIKKAPTRILYFFCKAGHVEKRLPIHVLRSLLSQLWRFDDSLYFIMERLYQSSGRPIADCYSDLCSATREALSQHSSLPLFIVIDALDECNESPDLINFLRTCQSGGSPHLRLIFTSRDHPDLRRPLQFCNNLVTIPVHTVKDAIKKYVSQRTSQMPFLQNMTLGGEVVDSISLASDGLWLYAKLLLDEIAQSSGPQEVKRLIQSLPDTIRDLYTSILTSVESRYSPSQVQLARQIFIWLDGADYMPWWHFHSDDILEDNTLSLLIRFVLREDVFDATSLIEKLCFPLVKVFRTDGDDTARIYAANFIHFSAEQYLQWTNNSSPRILPNVMKPRRLRRLYRGVTAAWYFSESEDFRAVLQQLRDDPYSNGVGAYFEMAYGMGDSWHMPVLPPNLEDEEVVEVDSACAVLVKYITTPDCLGWAEAAILINYAGGYRNLLENVEKAIGILSTPQANSSVGWSQYLRARETFFTDWAYILRKTGPGYHEVAIAPDLPAGFHNRDVAQQIMKLAQHYQFYVDEAFEAANSTANQTGPVDTPALGKSEWLRRRSSASSTASVNSV